MKPSRALLLALLPLLIGGGCPFHKWPCPVGFALRDSLQGELALDSLRILDGQGRLWRTLPQGATAILHDQPQSVFYQMEPTPDSAAVQLFRGGREVCRTSVARLDSQGYNSVEVTTYVGPDAPWVLCGDSVRITLQRRSCSE